MGLCLSVTTVVQVIAAGEARRGEQLPRYIDQQQQQQQQQHPAGVTGALA